MKLLDLLRESNIHFCTAGEHHHVREGWIGLDCPWCPTPRGDKGRYRLGVQPSTGRANCWVCGRHSLAEVVSKCGKMPLGTALSALEGMKLDKLAVKAEKQAAGRVASDVCLSDRKTACRPPRHPGVRI